MAAANEPTQTNFRGFADRNVFGGSEVVGDTIEIAYEGTAKAKASANSVAHDSYGVRDAIATEFLV